MPGRKGMKWGQHIFGDDDYDPHGRPAQIKTWKQYENTSLEDLNNPLKVGPKITTPAAKDSKTGQRLSSNYVQYHRQDKDGNFVAAGKLHRVEGGSKNFVKASRDLLNKKSKDKHGNMLSVGAGAYGNKHYYQNALEMGNKIAGTYSHMSDADRSLMAKYGINMNPRRNYYAPNEKNLGGDFNQSGVAQARAYQQAVRAQNRASRSDIGNALHDAYEGISNKYKDVRGRLKRDLTNIKLKFNKTAVGQLVKEYKKRKARARNDLRRAADKVMGK